MTLVLGLALAAVFAAMLLWRRHLGSLMQVASLLAAVLVLIWLQDHGYLAGPGGRTGPGAQTVPLERGR